MSIAQWFASLFGAGRKSSVKVGGGRWTIASASKKMQDAAKAAAQRDGEAGLPGSVDANLTPYEQSIVELSRQVVQTDASDMQRADAELVPDFLEAKRDFQSAQLAYERRRREIGGRPIRIEIAAWVYLTLVALLMAGEVAVNYTAFEAVFGERVYLTALAAATLGIALLVIAHFIGAAIRQRKQLGWVLVLGVVVVGMTIGLAYVRLKFIETHNAESQLLGGVQLDQKAISGFFFVFNLLYLGAAAWMAALRHDADAEYEEAHRQYQRARARALKCKKARDGSREAYMGDAMEWVGIGRRLLALYRETNLNVRESRATPRAWLMHPLDPLIQLDESLFQLKVTTDIGLLQDEPDAAVYAQPTAAGGQDPAALTGGVQP